MEEERKHCTCCGNELEEVYIYTHDGEPLCENCYQEHYFTCEDCGEVYHTDYLYWADGGNRAICEDCFDENYTTCHDCGEVVYNDNTYYVDDGGYYVCGDCDNNYAGCYGCGNVYHYDNLREDEDGDYFCESCYEERYGRTTDTRIYQYHGFSDWRKYKHDNEVDSTSTPLIYIGQEMEFEPKGVNNIPGLLDAMDKYLNAIAMRDGSLNSGGVEIISHPETYAYKLEHKESYKQFFKKVEELRYGHVNESGLHFHVSRPQNNEVISRLIVILESFKDEIKKLSRRDGNFHWSKFLTDGTSSDKDKLKYQCKKWLDENYTNQNGYGERYLALNLCNRNTIEFRFFNGVNNFEEFWGALQFIHNLMTIASNLSIELNTINWQDLIKGQELESQAIKYGVYGIDKYVKDTTEIIEKFEETLMKSKKEIVCILRNLARYINKEMSEFDLTEIRTNNVDFIDERVNQFLDRFKYRQQYLNKVMSLYKALIDEENRTRKLEMNDIKNYWENAKSQFPVNTERYKRYDKLIEKVINKYESEVM